MGAIKATDNIHWVGVLDKNLRVFDIIMYTEYGTSYNSFIVKGSKKTVLFETVKDKFYDEFYANINEVCDPAEIDYIVVNHTEPDHTGSLRRLLEHAPNATVLASQTAIAFLKDIVNEPFPHKVVTEKDTIDIGDMTMQFLSVPMLHWPDSMYTFIPEIKALFTCDSLGCHYADERVFNDLMEDINFHDAYKYYFDNIMGPYKYPHVFNAMERIKNLDIEFVGNGHGPVLRTDIPKYIEMYREWSKPAPAGEKFVVIPYVSAYGYTASLAKAIERGLYSGGVKKVKLYDLVTDPMEKAKTDVENADGIIIGSPTLVGDALPPIYEVMLGLNPVVHRGKLAGAFGSYGWSGEAVHNITSRLEQLRMNIPLPGIRVRLKPTEEDFLDAFKYGEDFARELLGH